MLSDESIYRAMGAVLSKYWCIQHKSATEYSAFVMARGQVAPSLKLNIN